MKRKQSNFFLKILNNNQGATSVLIILLLVVLMIFGLTILTTTLSNESLSNKKNEWLSDYYKLESKVAVNLADIDLKIQEIKEEVITNENKKEVLISRFKELEEVVVENNSYYFLLEVSENSGEYNKYISIKAELIIPDDGLSDSEYLALENYRIIKYSESQELFEYKDIEFGIPYAPGEK